VIICNIIIALFLGLSLVLPVEHKKNLSEEEKDMIVNEISLVIQNIISFLIGEHSKGKESYS